MFMFYVVAEAGVNYVRVVFRDRVRVFLRMFYYVWVGAIQVNMLDEDWY